MHFNRHCEWKIASIDSSVDWHHINKTLVAASVVAVGTLTSDFKHPIGDYKDCT